MVALQDNFIPEAIKEIIDRNNASVEVLESPKGSDNEVNKHLIFATIKIKKEKTDIGVDLLYNQKTMKEFRVMDVYYLGYNYSEDDYGDDLPEAIDGIIQGRIKEKKNWWGKKYLVICDQEGKEKFYPRS